ncbi:hypothetical protein HRbin27_01769 [bacterium HR27]|nr:hypothetical protein HRbin27_01769 [bacterium HR27]
MFPSPRCLDRRVERQKVCLLGDGRDRPQDLGDRIDRLREFLDAVLELADRASDVCQRPQRLVHPRDTALSSLSGPTRRLRHLPHAPENKLDRLGQFPCHGRSLAHLFLLFAECPGELVGSPHRTQPLRHSSRGCHQEFRASIAPRGHHTAPLRPQGWRKLHHSLLRCDQVTAPERFCQRIERRHPVRPIGQGVIDDRSCAPSARVAERPVSDRPAVPHRQTSHQRMLHEPVTDRILRQNSSTS